MPRRIEVELTSARDDGTWTWRAAGARQPKGTLDGTLLFDGAKVGDVVRADADFDIDGITIVAVLPPRGERTEPERLEIVGPARPTEAVTTNWSGRDRPERGGRDRDRGDRRERGRPGGDRGRPGGGEGRRPPDRDRAERRDRGDRGERRERPDGRRPPRAPAPQAEPKPKPKRLRPARTHRNAVVESLPPEQRPVADQVLRGGIPAVRQAVDDQNAKRSEGQPEVKPDALVALAEELLPRLRTAEWRDRADAALAEADELDLRDLRSVVVAADDAARDDETRELAGRLRDALAQRVEREHAAWLADLEATLADGRVVRALRLSSRPPKAGARFPTEISTRLATLAGEALTSDTSQERWAAVLDAVAYSPVRRAVRPAGVPAAPKDDLLAIVRKLADRVPDIAAMFGVEAAPAPTRPGGRRTRGRRSGGGGRAPAAAKAPKDAPVPPPPPPAEPPAGSPEETVASAVAEAPAETPVETAAPPADVPAESRAEPAAEPPAPPPPAPEPPPAEPAAEAPEAPAPPAPPAPEPPAEPVVPPAVPDPRDDAWNQVLLETPMGSLRREDDDTPDDEAPPEG